MLLLEILVGCSTCGWGNKVENHEVSVDLAPEDLDSGGSGSDLTCEDLCLAELGAFYPQYDVESCNLTPLDDGGTHLSCVASGPYALCD